jgi:hypothetical protein
MKHTRTGLLIVVLVLLLAGLVWFASGETIHLINVGATPNDGTGDSLRTAFVKVNSNFVTLASRPLADLSGYYTKAQIDALLAALPMENGGSVFTTDADGDLTPSTLTASDSAWRTDADGDLTPQ